MCSVRYIYIYSTFPDCFVIFPWCKLRPVFPAVRCISQRLLDQERGKLRHVSSDPSCHRSVQTEVETGAGAAGAATTATAEAVVGAEGGLCGSSGARYVVLIADAGRRVNQAHAGASVWVTVTAAAGKPASWKRGQRRRSSCGHRAPCVPGPRGVCCGDSGDGSGGRSTPWQHDQRRHYFC